MQSQRAQESQHRATSPRQAFRALSAGVLPRADSAKKRGPWLPQPASQGAPCMAQEHGRNTLSARAEPSTRHIWHPSGALSARASTWEKLHCRIMRFAESLASLPSTSPRQSIASCTLLVSSNMGLTGFGLSFNLSLGDNGVSVSSWTLSLWRQAPTTSLQTWEIRPLNGKMGSVHPWLSCCLEASREVLICCRTLSSPAGPLVSCVLAL